MLIVSRRRAALAIATACCALFAPSLFAHSSTPSSAVRDAPAALSVRKELGPVPDGVIELKFRDLFKMPIGPRGLEPSDALRAAEGKRVRIVGFMVQQDPAPKGGFLLSPLPVAVGDEDEGLADDLPPALILVELAGATALPIPTMRGLLQINGILRLGAHELEGDPRTTFVRITANARTERAVVRTAGVEHAASTP